MIKRFLAAQEGSNWYPSYDQALSEIQAGRKQSHWIWYIFPQLKGLVASDLASENTKKFGIKDLDEAVAYLAEPVLRARLIEISEALLVLPEDDPVKVMNSRIDARKLQSCMTLFAAADPDCPVFQQVLDKYFNGRPDPATISLLKKN